MSLFWIIVLGIIYLLIGAIYASWYNEEEASYNSWDEPTVITFNIIFWPLCGFFMILIWIGRGIYESLFE